MKREILASIIIITEIYSGSLLAQSLLPASLVITKPVHVISYEPVFVLEAGIDNTIHVEVNDSTVKRLLVNASQGTVQQEGNDFVVHPETPGELTLTVYNYNDIDHPVLLEERKIQVASGPFATLGGKHSGRISKEELRYAMKIGLSGIDKSMIVQNFKLSVDGTGIEYKEFIAHDENLTAAMMESLLQLPAGGKIFIEYIRAGKATDCCTRHIPPLQFTVID